jgi:glucose/arabinose dehydrogenase
MSDLAMWIQRVTRCNICKLGLITDLQVGPDGNMYVLADYKRDGTIFRIITIDNTTNVNDE